MDKLKERAAPKHTELMVVMEKLYDEQVTTNTLLAVLCDSSEAVVNVTNAVLDVKIQHHNDWIEASAKRFYVAVLSIMATGAVLYLDVLKLDENSAIVEAGINLYKLIEGVW